MAGWLTAVESSLSFGPACHGVLSILWAESEQEGDLCLASHTHAGISEMTPLERHPQKA